THAWFACYAPADKPRIAIASFVEHGGHGGTTCAPIAKAVLEKFFEIDSAAKTTEKVAADAKPKAKSKTKRH
ncbi:hypothetical protein ABI003_15335, partial [Enterococcus faecium]|uniref:hypothetical protein n=1 Tax=Enterococcus faecium TaxID=1352 RepID=UPI003F438825